MGEIRRSSQAEVSIADSSVLIALASIGQFGLLRQLCESLVVPEGVYYEVAVRGSGKPGDGELREALSSWIDKATPAITIPPPYRGMRRGEIEVISYGAELAQQGTRVRLLLDDRPGRRRAIEEKLRIIGTLGILKSAKGRGLLPVVKPLLDGLTQRGFRARRQLLDCVLRQLNEL